MILRLSVQADGTSGLLRKTRFPGPFFLLGARFMEAKFLLPDRRFQNTPNGPNPCSWGPLAFPAGLGHKISLCLEAGMILQISENRTGSDLSQIHSRFRTSGPAL